MKNWESHKKFLPLLLFFVLLKGIPASLVASSNLPSKFVEEQPLGEVLEALGEKYQVFLSYEPSLIKEIYVDFDIRPEEKLEDAIDRLLTKTNFTYELVNEKFLVVYSMDKKGQRKANKIRKKFKQIQNLEREGNLSIQRNSKNPEVNALTILSSIRANKRKAVGPGTISGTVVDRATGEELLYANVQLEGTSLGTTTNELGEFVIHQVPAGEYNLIATYIGYDQQSVSVTVVADQTTEVTIELDYAGVTTEEVIVSAQASGQMSAINNQLNSNTIKNVVSSDRIQDVPDVNAAESVSRLPGLSLIRSGGEGQKVAIRGISPQYNVTMVNGVRMQSTDRDNRSVDLNMIAPNILSGIEVTKAATADMDADAVGGTVNLKIAPAGEGLRGKFSLQGGYGSQAQTYGNYRATGLLSNRFFNNKLGVQVSGFLDNFDRSSDAADVRYRINEQDVLVDGLIPIDLNQVIVSDRATNRQRTGGSLVFDYQLGDKGSLILNNFISQLDQESLLQRNQLTVDGQQWTGIMEEQELKNTTYSNALTGEYDFGAVGVDFTLSNSVSKQRVPHHLQMQFQIAQNEAGYTTPGLENPREATWSELLSAAEVINGPTDRRISRFETLRRTNTEEAQQASLNFTVPFALSEDISGRLKFGGKYIREVRDNDEEQTHTDPDRNPMGEQFMMLVMDSLGNPFGLNGIDRNLGIRAFIFEDPDYDVGELLNGEAGIDDLWFKGDVATANRYKELAEETGFYGPEPQESTQYDYRYQRNLTAFYASAEVNIGKRITLFPGIRREQFAFKYDAFSVQRWGQFITEFDQEDISDDTNEGDNWFPQLQLRVKPTDWFDIRMAATRSIIYPDYRAVSPFIFIDTYNNPTMQLGNPMLRPALSQNLDVYASVFNNKLGLFTVGVFQKEIDDLIVSSSFRTRDAADIDNRFELQTNAQTQVNTWINLDATSRVRGIELDWQTSLYYLPGFLKGIVLSVNYTHMSSKTAFPFQTAVKEGSGPFAKTVFVDSTRTGRMPNQPNDVFNFTFGYDIGGFSGRLTYQYTDNILTGVERTFAELDTYTGAYRRWDFTAYQKLPWLGGGLQVYVNVNNITNTPDREFTSVLEKLRLLQYYGRTVDVGLRYSFD